MSRSSEIINDQTADFEVAFRDRSDRSHRRPRVEKATAPVDGIADGAAPGRPL